MPKRSPNSRAADDINKSFGTHLRSLRGKAGRSQTDVGKALGVSFQQIQKYENGTTSISLDRLHQLAGYFSVPIVQLVDRLGQASKQVAAGFAAPEQSSYDAGATVPTSSPQLSKESETLLNAFQRIRSRKLRRSILVVVEGYGPTDEHDNDNVGVSPRA